MTQPAQTTPSTIDPSLVDSATIAHLEGFRRKAGSAWLAFWAALLVIAAVVALIVSQASGVPGTGAELAVGAVVLLAPLIYLLVRATGAQGRFNSDFDSWRDDRVLKALDPACDYDAHASLPREEYDASLLFPEQYNGYAGANLVSRRIGETGALASSLHVTYTWQTTRTEHYTDAQGHSQTRTVTESHTVVRFSGTMFRFDAPKEFQGWVTIEPRGGAASRSGVDVLMPSQEFSEHFTVQAADEFTAHYLLSPDTLARFLSLRARAGGDIWASFVGGRLYVALPGWRWDFGSAPSVLRAVRPEDLSEIIARCRANLLFIEEMVAHLDLNTRIWSKT